MVVESAPNGILAIDAEGRIVLVNSQTERMFGYARDELLGATVEMLLPDRLRETHPAHRKSFFTDPRGCAAWESGATFSAGVRTAAKSPSKSDSTRWRLWTAC